MARHEDAQIMERWIVKRQVLPHCRESQGRIKKFLEYQERFTHEGVNIKTRE